MINPLIRYEQKFNEKISASTTGEFMRADNLYPFTLVNGDYVSKENAITTTFKPTEEN